MPVQRSRHTNDNRLLYLGVALLFAPLGIMISFIGKPVPTWSAGLCLAVFSGVVATGWAFSFATRRFWLLALVIPFSIFAPNPIFSNAFRLGMFSPGSGVKEVWRAVILVCMAVLFLSVGFVCMIMFVRRKEAAGARASAELELARGVHDALVPGVDFAGPPVGVLGVSSPSDEMGGDLIDLVVRDAPTGTRHEVDVYLADVSGHGVAAGIVMGMLKSAIRTSLRHPCPLGALVDDLNSVLSDLTQPHMFATLACVRCTARASPAVQIEVEYALAGHLPILIIRADGGVEELHNQALPLGVVPGERCASGRTTLAHGDLLAMYTDGLNESRDQNGRELGLPAVRDIIVRAATGAGASAPLRTIHDAVLAAVRARAAQTDDQSLVLIRPTDGANNPA